jgi:UDP-glucose 4-epimerase
MNKRNNKVVLIGGSGFVGKALNRFFSNKLEWNVKSIDKKEVDLTQEVSQQTVKEVVEIFDPHNIVILAAIKRQDGDSTSILELNNKITKNISCALRGFNKQIIYFSSCAVYGEKNEQKRIDEENILYPTSHYGIHKVFSESLYRKTFRSSKNLLVVRPPLIYSEKETSGYNPGGFLHSARKDQHVKLWGDGSELREFIHINDITNVVGKLMSTETTGVVNLVAGKSYSYKEIASIICDMYKAKLIMRERTGKMVNHTYDPTRLKSLIGSYTFQSPLEVISALQGDISYWSHE